MKKQVEPIAAFPNAGKWVQENLLKEQERLAARSRECVTMSDFDALVALVDRLEKRIEELERDDDW